MDGNNIVLIFNALDFIVRLVLVVFFFLIASTLKKSDPDVIRSRLFLEYNRLTESFNLVFIGSIFFLIAAFIEYFFDPSEGDTNFMIMKISLTIFQIIVIYFIAVLNTAIGPAGKGGL